VHLQRTNYLKSLLRERTDLKQCVVRHTVWNGVYVRSLDLVIKTKQNV